MQQPIVCFLLVIIGVVAGAPSSNERIIGGTPVSPDPTGATTPFPYVVSIEDDRNHFCGGFIYNPKWVVTTASCMENKVISKLTVVAGQVHLIDLEPTEDRQSVFRVIPYDTYNNVTRKDDIALIELSNPFTLTPPAVRDLIKFNEVFTDTNPTPNGFFVGWGATVLGGSFSPRIRYADVTMLETSPTCNPYSADEFTISTMICAAGVPSTASPAVTPAPCGLDEGSPLVQTYATAVEEKTIVVGVLSKYSPICDAADSSVFTRLSVYYAWLYRTAGDQVYTTL